jgi:hypothetical protein
MIKISSRFFAVLMLAVLACTDVAATSAFAAGRNLRSAPAVESLIEHVDPLRRDGLKNPDVNRGLSADPSLLDPAVQERGSQSGSGIRSYPYVAPVWPD